MTVRELIETLAAENECTFGEFAKYLRANRHGNEVVSWRELTSEEVGRYAGAHHGYRVEIDLNRKTKKKRSERYVIVMRGLKGGRYTPDCVSNTGRWWDDAADMAHQWRVVTGSINHASTS